MVIKILENCCSSTYLDVLKNIASNSENWNLKYPTAHPIEDRFRKLVIVGAGIEHPLLAGLALGLLLQIHEAGGQDLFIPEICFCGISIKDKHRLDNIHIDHPEFSEDGGVVKILGIINSDWEEKWGGGFIHNETKYYIKPTSFCIFDSTVPHVAEEIITDKKRFAIDFTVYRDQQAFEKRIKKWKDGNKQNN